MAFPLIPLVISALAEIAPAVVGAITNSDKAEEKAAQIAGIAKSLTGAQDAESAFTAIKANPELLLQFQRDLMQWQTEQYRSETDRLRAVNETMRAEAMAQDPWTRRWRPYFGYIAATTWAIQGVIVFGLVAYVVVNMPDKISDTLGAITALLKALAEHWMFALAVLGVAVWKRSDDKKVAAGQNGDYGIFGAIASRIRRP